MRVYRARRLFRYKVNVAVVYDTVATICLQILRSAGLEFLYSLYVARF